MAATSGSDLVAVAFATLTPDEQEEAFARISDVRLTRLAGEASETALFIRSLRRVADVAGVAGDDLSPGIYRRVRGELVKAGEEVAEFSAVCRHFGSWSRGKEALGLSEVTTSLKIDARFRSRLMGRQRTFRLPELEEALKRCVDDLGRIPLLSEYDEWRQREVALERARGEARRVPSAAVFRRRHGTWEGALIACGYSSEDVYVRLEPRPERRSRLAKVDRYSEATLRDTLERCARDLGRPPLVEEFDEWRQRELSRTRSRNVLLPSNSPYRRRWGTWERALLYFGFTPEAIAERLAPGRAKGDANLVPFQVRRRDLALTEHERGT